MHPVLNVFNKRNAIRSADNISYRYDLVGHRIASNQASYPISYRYDNAGRMIATTAGGKTLSYQYDADGNRIRTTWPEATPFYVTASYDALNRPTALLENGSVKLANYAYDDLSRRTLVTLANGTTTGYSYDPQSGLKTLTQNLTGTAQDNTWTYTRNQAQDIKTDAWTNDLYRWTGYTNGTRTYSVNGRNQYAVQTTTGSTHSNGSSTFNYDANANLTGDGVWTYAYNLENRLTSASKTGWAATLNYDGEGRLTRTTLAGVVTNLTYDNVNLLAEYNASGNLLRRYVHGPGIDQPLVWYEGATITNKNWLYTDHQGTIIATANSLGNSTATYSYGPYGEPNQTTGVRFRYTGQQLIGPLNLYYYKARFYSPAIGRFLQTDPIGYSADMNLYAYCGNNPINCNDPTGNAANVVAGIGGAIIGGLAGGTTAYIKSDGNLSSTLQGATFGALLGGTTGLSFGANLASPSLAALWSASIGGASNAFGQFAGNQGVINLSEVGVYTGLNAIPGAIQTALINDAVLSGLGQNTINALGNLALVGQLKIGTEALGQGLSAGLPSNTVNLSSLYNSYQSALNTGQNYVSSFLSNSSSSSSNVYSK